MDLGFVGDAAFDEARLEPAHHQVVERFGVFVGRDVRQLARVARRQERPSQRRREQLARARDFAREGLGQAAAREREGPRRFRAFGILGLRCHPAYPSPHGLARGLGGAHARLEIVGQARDPFVEDGDQQLVLAAEVAVEGLVREAGLGEDVRDLGIEAARPLDHREARTHQALDLGARRLASDGEAAIDGRIDDRGASSGFFENLVLHIENTILGRDRRQGASRGVPVGEQAEGQRLLVGEIIRRAAAAVPGRPAVAVGPDQRTYAELEREAERLAHALRTQLGIGYGDRVLGWIDTAIEVMPLFVALARLGAVFAPLNARLSADEAGDVAKLARGSLLVVDPLRAKDARRLAQRAGIDRIALLRVERTLGDEEGKGAPRVDASFAPLDARTLPDPPAPIVEPRLVETDPHVIFFTSGSTGRPKGVVLSHRANWLRGFQGVFRDEPERTVCMFPLFHMAGFTLAISAWQTRGEVAYTTAGADALLRMVEARRANRLYGLPAIWKRIVEADLSAYDLSSLEQLDTGTSATPIELLRDMKRCFPRARIRVYYGSTEVGTGNALCDADVLRKPGSVGQPAVSVDVRLAPDGEICIRSPFLCDGYFDDPKATSDALVDGWFHTGDLGAFDDEGYLSIVGRKKEILRTGGESVSPAEVEAVLRDAPGVEEVALVGLPDPHWGDLLCAAVVAKPGASPTLAALQAHCEGRLASFKKPRRIARLMALPRTTATNQVQRTLLVEQIVANGLAEEA